MTKSTIEQVPGSRSRDKLIESQFHEAANRGQTI